MAAPEYTRRDELNTVPASRLYYLLSLRDGEDKLNAREKAAYLGAHEELNGRRIAYGSRRWDSAFKTAYINLITT